jgi:prepilin-type N-terminal cleavage/methylation domain-containing protein
MDRLMQSVRFIRDVPGTHRRRRPAFTLVELVVVIGIVALLLSILLPTLTKAREAGYRVVCVNNCRSLCTASIAFATDHKGLLPNCNWAPLEARDPAGWLYKAPNHGVNASGGDAPDDRRAGQLFKYLGSNGDSYLCPIHDRTAPRGPTEHITSYMMNGAVCGYGGIPAPATSYPLRLFRPDAILFWEADEGPPRTPLPFNDGSSSPSESLTKRHGTGASLGCFDGRVEYFPVAEWQLLQVAQPGRLWCSPLTANGQ